jgi:argininosuccinate lyase
MSNSPQKEPEKSWQARIGEATDAIAQSFVESISYDRRMYKHDIAGSIAHATMLEKVGLITGAEREAIEAACGRSRRTSKRTSSTSTSPGRHPHGRRGAN